jgi:TonB-dependent starch-binding outer membrane protein SusC
VLNTVKNTVILRRNGVFYLNAINKLDSDKHSLKTTIKTLKQSSMTKLYLLVRRYLAVALMFGALTSFAQQTVTGKVTAADDGSGIPGVNILEKGTTNGTVSDSDGNYTINVGANATLVFSFVGYTTQEVSVAGQSALNVSLQSDVTALSEVVVIGYGAVKINDATGAVAAVSSSDFNGGIISSPEQLIQGKTAGVQITSTSGVPGAGVNLRIRGTTSIRSNNNPLFVVDGVPLAGGATPSAADVGYGTNQDTNPLNFLNPSDIESMSILKDASATAIYGSRGANGVVLITTKSGRGGKKGLFELSSNLSISSLPKKYDLLSPSEFLDGVEQYGGDPVAQDLGSETDWQDYIFRASVSNSQNLSYSKGFKTGSIRASLGYDNQVGIVENSSMKRLTGRINGTKSFFNDKLKLDLSTTISNVKREDPALGASAGFQGDLLGAAYSANPTWPTEPDFNTGGQRSPANMLEYYRSLGSNNRFLTNLSANYNLSNNLSAKATYGLDFSKGVTNTMVSGEALNAGNGVAGNGQGQLNENRTINNLFELTMNYNKKVGNVQIDAVGGYSIQSFRNDYFWAVGRGFTDFSNFDNMEDELRNSYEAGNSVASQLISDYHSWGVADVLRDGAQSTGGFVGGPVDGELQRSFFARPAGVTLTALGANSYDRTDFLQSYFGRGNFTISDKYLLTATVRIDGSSRFGDEDKYGIFPSGAFAWKLHEEDFMPDAFSTFKFRAGWGVVGNQDGLGYGEFLRRERFADVGINDGGEIGIPGTTTQGFANQGLKWEQTAQTSVGIDFGFTGDKFSGSFDVYVKNTTDLLLRVNSPQPALADQNFENLDAIVQNKGWELALSYSAIEKEGASLSFSGNVSYNKNELKDFDGAIDAGTIRGQGLSLAYAQRLAGGQPLFSYFLRPFDGFGSDGNPTPATDIQTFVGKTALPTWNVGFSVNAKLKSFDFATYFTGQFGHYVYNNTANAFFTAGSISNARNVTKDVLTNGEGGLAEASVSTRFLEKGDFLRMQNFSLGYTVPLKESKTLRSLRFYVNGQNLFLLTKYSGLDPEVSSSPADSGLLNQLPTAGIDYAAYPRPRTFSFGLNASF